MPWQLLREQNKAMILDNVVVSEDFKNLYFLCCLEECKGMCCVEGDAGAPLEDEEVGIIEDMMEIIYPYMDEVGAEIVKNDGVLDFDEKGSLVTPLKPNDECVYMVWENGHTACAFEKAYMDGRTKFQKPVSCHLYPARIETKGAFDEMDYHRWEICDSALTCGEEKKVHVLKLIGDGLTRKYGKDWYRRLCDRWNIH